MYVSGFPTGLQGLNISGCRVLGVDFDRAFETVKPLTPSGELSGTVNMRVGEGNFLYGTPPPGV